MENATKNYTTATLDEYFAILDRENEKRNHIVAKSLVKYLQKSKTVDAKVKKAQ